MSDRMVDYYEAKKDIDRRNNKLYVDERAVFNTLYTELNPFTPNWKCLKLKSKVEGRKHIIDCFKKEAKHLADRGYGEVRILDGNLNVLANLKGSNIKRKKEFIQA